MEITILIICIGLVCAFEFINGFHDTANAVAPVIYTNSLSPKVAVAFAAFFNFIGVILGGIGVAMGIIHLLPLDMIANQPTTFGIAVVLSLLISAIIWNFGTWYLGIPASSSHTLIGSILGVSLMMYTLDSSVVLPWKKVTEVFESLLLSPVAGFVLAFGLLHILHLTITSKDFYRQPGRFWNKEPKTWIKGGLILSSWLVSGVHGSNDGQKGVGLAMLILISIMPVAFAINPSVNIKDINQASIDMITQVDSIQPESLSPDNTHRVNQLRYALSELRTATSLENIEKDDVMDIRRGALHVQTNYKALAEVPLPTADGSTMDMTASMKVITDTTDYAPWWIIAMISISLGLGTMVGWKRIVVTIGEKIGKEKLTYAQGTVASLMTAITIGASTFYHLPVSTTHILSSSVAGTMAHEHGKNGLQGGTIKSILMAWVLTLPVSTVLAASIFYILEKLLVA